MIPQTKIGASILSADFARLADALKKCESAGIDYIHLDVMDGCFVPNISFGPVVIKAIRRNTRLPLDAHLMIDAPHRYISEFINAGADIISVHSECYGTLTPAASPQAVPIIGARGPDKFPKEITALDTEKILPVLKQIRAAGKKAVVALNPGTPLCIQKILDNIDGVLIMSVNPGFSGQSFMPSVLPKISALRKIYQGDIYVDGGVNDKVAPDIIRAGANCLVTASYFFNAPDPAKAVKILKES